MDRTILLTRRESHRSLLLTCLLGDFDTDGAGGLASESTLYGFTTVPSPTLSSGSPLTNGATIVSLLSSSGPFAQGMPYQPPIAGTSWVHLAQSVLHAVLVPRVPTTTPASPLLSGGVLTVLATIPTETRYSGECGNRQVVRCLML